MQDTTSLFADYQKARHIALDDRIVEDIHTRTAGYCLIESLKTISADCSLIWFARHPSLVNLCGRLLDETLRVDKSSVTYEDWLRYATFRLEADAADWPTMQKLMNVLKGSSSDVVEMRALLYRRFLPNAEGVPRSTLSAHENDIARFLTAEGALRYEVGEAKYSVCFS